MDFDVFVFTKNLGIAWVLFSKAFEFGLFADYSNFVAGTNERRSVTQQVPAPWQLWPHRGKARVQGKTHLDNTTRPLVLVCAMARDKFHATQAKASAVLQMAVC